MRVPVRLIDAITDHVMDKIKALKNAEIKKEVANLRKTTKGRDLNQLALETVKLRKKRDELERLVKEADKDRDELGNKIAQVLEKSSFYIGRNDDFTADELCEDYIINHGIKNKYPNRNKIFSQVALSISGIKRYDNKDILNDITSNILKELGL